MSPRDAARAMLAKKPDSLLSETTVRRIGWPGSDLPSPSRGTAAPKPKPPKPPKPQKPKRKLRHRIPRAPGLPTPFDIMRKIARRQDVDVRSMLGERMTDSLVRPRHLAMWLACELRQDVSISQIADEFRRDRTTLRHVQRKVANEIPMNAAAVWQALSDGATLDQIWPTKP